MKPIWKSVGFWMGGVVLVFLLWAWGDSMWWETTVGRGSMLGGTSLSVDTSRVTFARIVESEERWRQRSGSGYPIFYEWIWRRDNYGKGFKWMDERRVCQGWFPPIHWLIRHPVNDVQIVIPFWLVVSLFTLIWAGGLLVLRRWQRKRLVVKGW